MEMIKIDSSNIEEEHICCALGQDREHQIKASVKKEWMKERFQEGLVFQKLNARSKVFIEYMPSETAWKPVLGDNFIVIHCLWVSGRFKARGFASQLLEQCIAEGKREGKYGIVVISSPQKRPFLTPESFFLKRGFTKVDTAPPYFSLLCLKLQEEAPDPSFPPSLQKERAGVDKGFTFTYTRQCPFVEAQVGVMKTLAEKRGLEVRTLCLETSRAVQTEGSPFGTLGIYYEGRLISHEPYGEKKFHRVLDTLLG